MLAKKIFPFIYESKFVKLQVFPFFLICRKTGILPLVLPLHSNGPFQPNKFKALGTQELLSKLVGISLVSASVIVDQASKNKPSLFQNNHSIRPSAKRNIKFVFRENVQENHAPFDAKLACHCLCHFFSFLLALMLGILVLVASWPAIHNGSLAVFFNKVGLFYVHESTKTLVAVFKNELFVGLQRVPERRS